MGDTYYNSSQNEYDKAAGFIKDYTESTAIQFAVSKEQINLAREEFVEKFHYKRLEALTDDEILSAVFYTAGDNSNALCYWLEMNKDSREYFGGIAGGSAFKYGLFQKKDTGVWVTGSSIKPKELTDKADVIHRANEIVGELIKGAKIIEQASLSTKKDYERLDEELHVAIGEDYKWGWFHKYYSILFPDKLSCYHNKEWQYHMLRCLGIEPSEKYYVRSGQIAMIQNRAGLLCSEFGEVMMNRFGGPKTFIRVGTNDSSKSYVDEWRIQSVIGIGWNALGSLEDYLQDGSLDKNKIVEKLQDEYYPTDKNVATRKAGEIIRFYNSDANTVFVAMAGEKLVAFVDNIGPYYYDENSDMSHLKSGTWHLKFNENDVLPAKSTGKLTSCYQIIDENNLMYLYMKYYYEDNMGDKALPPEGIRVNKPEEQKKDFDKNLILYGPPGTGKTYYTVIYAVAICEDKSIESIRKEDYAKVKARYNKLYDEGRIAFTTFHQSYGYEEFIEGIKPDVDNNSSELGYIRADGIFKRFCEAAKSPKIEDVKYTGNVWAIRNRAGSNGVDKDFENRLYQEGVIKIDDLYDSKRQCQLFNRLEPGDWVVLGKNEYINAIGVVLDTVPEEIDEEIFHWQRKVKWLATGLMADCREINNGKGFSNFAVAKSDMKVQDLGKKFLGTISRRDPFVFIIDEINRGNISKIFGELITLIEETKRDGMEEQAYAILPYSQDKFSVPQNVYIIGTMNTADRSIALMDTALRRRFNFIEMQPDASLLEDVIVEDDEESVNIGYMLEVINERITYLYDREHTLGHALFMSLHEDNNIQNLASIFAKNVIPLLQEYFYEDYEKIRLVLGDNAKKNEADQFIVVKEISDDVFEGNISDEIDVPERSYKIAYDNFKNIMAYKRISGKL